MVEAPSDAEIEAALAVVPASAFERLWAAVAAMTSVPSSSSSSPSLGSWRGGGKDEDGVVEAPYVELGPAAEAVVDGLRGVGAVVPFAWPDWAAAHEPLLRSAAAIASAPVADVVRVVTSFVRGDRFNEGLLLEVAEDGRLAACVDGLRHWWTARTGGDVG